MTIIAGVDEAGRGPLAGPVVAACVILPAQGDMASHPLLGKVKDSKKLTPKKRDFLYDGIIEIATDWGIGEASVAEIDELNILQATLLAMRRAVLSLKVKPTKVLIDGNVKPDIPYDSEAIVKGDALEPAISAASILAKVTRDRMMLALDNALPEYGFLKHKGYGTKQHVDAIYQYGPSIHHRKTFAPVRNILNNNKDLG